MINVERLRQWTTALRNTTLGQVCGALVAVNMDGDITAACCLGIGEIECAGAEATVDTTSHFGVAIVAGYRDPGLPALFPRWLGVEHEALTSDVWLDTAPVFVDVIEDSLVEDDGTVTHCTYAYDRGIPASWLNDEAELTFSQIADMVDYFGVKVRAR